jgi:hypothetical protein
MLIVNVASILISNRYSYGAVIRKDTLWGRRKQTIAGLYITAGIIAQLHENVI